MLTGFLLDNRPFIPVTVGWKLGVQDLVALVDTGFTGELKVSPEAARELGLEVTHTQTISLGDGKTVIWQGSLAFVSLEGVKYEVSVLIGDGTTIAGVGLFKKFGYTLTMNFTQETFFLQRKDEDLFDG